MVKLIIFSSSSSDISQFTAMLLSIAILLAPFVVFLPLQLLLSAKRKSYIGYTGVFFGMWIAAGDALIMLIGNGDKKVNAFSTFVAFLYLLLFISPYIILAYITQRRNKKWDAAENNEEADKPKIQDSN